MANQKKITKTGCLQSVDQLLTPLDDTAAENLTGGWTAYETRLLKWTNKIVIDFTNAG
jgi:hypothetical protein